MKLYKLYEDKKHLSEKEMLKWCKENINNFSRYNTNTNNEDYVIDVKLQAVYSTSSNVYISIYTQDVELPFEINVATRFSIAAPNLKSFKNFPSVDFGEDELFPWSFRFIPWSFRFIDCGRLDFNDFYYTDKLLDVSFVDVITDNTKPQLLNTKQNFGTLTYNGDNMIDSDFFDFTKYVRLNDISQLILMPTTKLKNVTSIFDTKIKTVHIGVSKIYKFSAGNKLDKIINEHIKLGAEYAMDMAVELSDAGFEDEI